MKKATLRLLTITLLAGFFARADAQHTGFTVWGEPNAEAGNLPPEHRFVHPLTAPYYHEDSFVTTDVRAWFLYHDFPKSSPIGGGNAKVYALQARVALSDTFQFVAYKDGYSDFNTGALEESGWNDIALGFKCNFIQDWEKQFHAAAGIGYEFKTGQGKMLHNDSELRLWGSLNKGFNRLHLGSTLNLFLAEDKDSGAGNADRLSWHLHADYWINRYYSVVLELNGYHVLDEGREVLPFQGLDALNLGGGKNEDVVTIAFGDEFRATDQLSIRGAYEMPLTSKEDLFGYRWTFSAIYSF